MPKGFPKGDPRASAAGRKGGLKPKPNRATPSEDYKHGYNSGWATGVRHGRATTHHDDDEILPPFDLSLDVNNPQEG